jgi:SAM-dependent methyltransferase
MSKRPDEDAAGPDMEAGMTTAERRRRRRRGGGLRVPSDNVPRRTTTTPPVVPPVPEDPNLAVSIAYSFASDASGPMPRADTAELPAAELRADTLTGDGPDVSDIIAPEGQTTEVEVEDEGPFEVKTREMTAVDLEALGLEDPSGDGKVGRRSGPIPARTSGPSTTVIIDDDSTTSISTPPKPPIHQVPQPPAAATATPPAMPARSKAPTPAPPAPVSVKFRPQTPVTLPFDAPPGAFDDDDKSVEIDFEDPSRPSVDMHEYRMPGADAARPVSRAATVALSDDDLEELREAEARSGRIKPGAKTGETVQLSDTDLEDLGERAPTPRISDQVRKAETAGRIEKELAKATKEESGEIVVDVVEEIDSGDIAAPVAPIAHSTLRGLGANGGAAAAATNGGATAPVAHRPPPMPPAAHSPASGTPTVTAAHPPASPVSAKSGPDSHAPPPPPPAAQAKVPPPAPGKKPAVATTTAAITAAAKSPADKRQKRGKPWFEEIFDEDYLRTLPFLTPQATQHEAQFVVDVLGVQPGAQLLDLGCGYGRHAMELAARGFHLVGLDLSLPLLLRGADEAQRRGLSINFVHADMRELDFDAQFDGVYCLFSTFGFFDDETNKKTATAVARALKPGGRAVIEVLNRDYVIGELPTRVWWEGDGCVVLEEVEFNYFSSRIHSNRSVVFDDGRQIEQEISVRAYSLHELGKLLHAAGFRVVEVSGSVHTRGRYFGNHSRHIIVVAEKKPKDSDPAK